MLGQDLVAAVRAAGHDAAGFSRAELDITSAAVLTDAVRDARADIVVNCAAWTDVDGAEQDEDGALAVNGAGAGNVARAAAASGAWTIHISSDYVFDGSKRAPYLESDPVGPLSSYGRSKLAGERTIVWSPGASTATARSSWLFGAGGPCFPATILRLAGERDELKVVDDQVGCPTFTGHLAAALIELAEEPVAGIVHVAGGGECSWHRFAVEIVRVAGVDCEVLPGRTADLARPAPRPPYSVMRTERGGSVPSLPNWQDGLAAFMSAGVLTT